MASIGKMFYMTTGHCMINGYILYVTDALGLVCGAIVGIVALFLFVRCMKRKSRVSRAVIYSNAI